MTSNPLLGSEPTTVCAFPTPPMCYISNYTDAAVQSGQAPKPPTLPPWPSFSIYGQEYSVSTDEPIVSSLESQGIPRLHPEEFDHRDQLKKMNHSLLLNFLDLIDILIRNPSCDLAREQKLDSLNTLFVHMMHLVNEFRPHQARETVRVMLRAQLKQRSEVCDRLQQFYDKLELQFANYLEMVPDNIKSQVEGNQAESKESSDTNSTEVEPKSEMRRPQTLEYSNGVEVQSKRNDYRDHDENIALDLDSVE